MVVKDIWQEHPHLYHYTTEAGLLGLLETNELWASHIRALNDVSEFVLARDWIHKMLLPLHREWLQETCKNNPRLGKYVNNLGGIDKQAEDFTAASMRSVYEATGDSFFVFSFCGESKDPFVQKNGLLSQWRGYGAQQGFMVVFETRGFHELILKEQSNFDIDTFHLSDVIYDEEQADSNVQEDLKKIASYLASVTDAVANGRDGPEDHEARLAFIKLATRRKHHAFREEREVRLVASVTEQTKAYLDACLHAQNSPKPEKITHFRTGRGGLIPYVKLFGAKGGKLPIRKIVVGPSKGKQAIMETLRKHPRLREIEISVSDIPFI